MFGCRGGFPCPPDQAKPEKTRTSDSALLPQACTSPIHTSIVVCPPSEHYFVRRLTAGRAPSEHYFVRRLTTGRAPSEPHFVRRLMVGRAPSEPQSVRRLPTSRAPSKPHSVRRLTAGRAPFGNQWPAVPTNHRHAFGCGSPSFLRFFSPIVRSMNFARFSATFHRTQ
jgi:hypothetical protein